MDLEEEQKFMEKNQKKAKEVEKVQSLSFSDISFTTSEESAPEETTLEMLEKVTSSSK